MRRFRFQREKKEKPSLDKLQSRIDSILTKFGIAFNNRTNLDHAKKIALTALDKMKTELLNNYPDDDARREILTHLNNTRKIILGENTNPELVPEDDEGPDDISPDDLQEVDQDEIDTEKIPPTASEELVPHPDDEEPDDLQEVDQDEIDTEKIPPEPTIEDAYAGQFTFQEQQAQPQPKEEEASDDDSAKPGAVEEQTDPTQNNPLSATAENLFAQPPSPPRPRSGMMQTVQRVASRFAKWVAVIGGILSFSGNDTRSGHNEEIPTPNTAMTLPAADTMTAESVEEKITRGSFVKKGEGVTHALARLSSYEAMVKAAYMLRVQLGTESVLLKDLYVKAAPDTVWLSVEQNERGDIIAVHFYNTHNQKLTPQELTDYLSVVPFEKKAQEKKVSEEEAPTELA